MEDIIIHAPGKLSFSRKIVKYLPAAIKTRLPEEIMIIAVSPHKSLTLNRRYRNKRKPANVLSFLYGRAYGEIILCPAIIKKDAKKQGNAQVFQMTWMILHGMLHLSGLHHEKSKHMAQRAAQIENTILDILFNTSKETKN